MGIKKRKREEVYGPNTGTSKDVHEPKKPNYKEAIENAKKDICCGHSKFFWKTFKTCPFGDVILCDQCNQYFAVIKAMPWLVKQDFMVDYLPINYHNNHLEGRFACPVPLRVSQ